MIWIAITAFIISVAALTITKEIQHGKTERLKMDIKAHQVDQYNEFLKDTNEHMLSDQLTKEFKIIEIHKD